MLTSMPEYAKVQVRGKLCLIESTHDPRIERLQKQWISFFVEVSKRYTKKPTGEIISKVQRIPCVAFGKLSQHIKEIEMLLPMAVTIEGSISMRPADGRLEVQVDRLYSEEVVDPSAFDSFDE